MNKKPLVIAGLGRVDYALAAAIVVRHYGTDKTDILCTSTARLSHHLQEIASGKDLPSEIIIAGVGIHASIPEMTKAVSHLRKKNIQLTWISKIAAPEEVPEELLAEIRIVCDENKSLYQLAAEQYGEDIAGFDKIENPGKKQNPYANLINASFYYFRNYQNKEPCYSVIRRLANKDPEESWSDEERRIVTTFLRSGNRELGGTSKAINELRRRITIAAERNVARVLIIGESGTGKETVALLIHNKSPRGKESMISFNCASVSPQLLESRFLGSKKGAYTGAEDRDGLFKMAQGSTLFLDEIGELPLDAQGILLRALEEGKFYPLGSNTEERVDIHLIAATNRDLAKMVAEGKFREDLYYRLNIVQLKVPALRERLEDIKDIANNRWRSLTGKWLTSSQVEELKSYDYPGNVRELFAILERAAIFEDSLTNVINEERATQLGARKAAGKNELPDNLEEVIRFHVRNVYEKYGHNVAKTAIALGKAENTVRKYIS